ncbi:MAG: ATP-dependent helicase [Bacteroidota bacterium]|jgi:DNA helicase-2/ATP-dependent DNA helicase PcrA
MVIPITITAEDRIADIESHFKLSAGPGAGKTRWLTNHIRHVIKNSLRLGNARKIACITFTNIAADTILRRLGPQVDRTEVSTIHSFLYRHLIKPFAFLISKEHELRIDLIDGHDDIAVSKGMIYEWKKETNQLYITDDQRIVEALSDLAWQFDENGYLVVKTRKIFKAKVGKYSIKNDSYLQYKKMYWRKGLLAHDDVLYFSHFLIVNNPRLLDVIRAKFPYLFIDEFQDTNPIQTFLLKKIAEKESTVGVIGDVAQSIYGFQGAKPEQFVGFSLPGLKEYTILDNHRSTNKIISVLNAIRSDLRQNGIRTIEGTTPKMLVGTKFWAMDEILKTTKTSVCTLSRDNITSNMMRDRVLESASKINLIEELREKDNTTRANVIIACIRAVELANQTRYKEALKEISRQLKYSDSEIDIPKSALKILRVLLSNRSEFSTKTLLDFHSFVSRVFPIKLAGFRKGTAMTFYSSNTYNKVSLSVNLKEDDSPHRTIHKAKGAEFDHVLLVLDRRDEQEHFLESDELGFLLTPMLDTNEEHRVRYVGISRARETLAINVPSLTAGAEAKAKSMGFEILRQIETEESVNRPPTQT